MLPTKPPHETVELKGLCEGELMVTARATCVPVVGGNGQWWVDYVACETGSLEQLSNLLQVRVFLLHKCIIIIVIISAAFIPLLYELSTSHNLIRKVQLTAINCDSVSSSRVSSFELDFCCYNDL